MTLRTFLLVGLFLISLQPPLHAESQGQDYKGITDPFGDPNNYEFSEEEKEDKEFFHLGRFLMLGLDAGSAIYTGGLGSTTNPGFYFGGRLIYFFDRAIGLELGAHYSSNLDQIRVIGSPTSGADVDTTLFSLTLAFRYYFDVRSAPRAIAVANPYVLLGGGYYMRGQTAISSNLPNFKAGDTSAFGAFGGAGVEFLIYRRHIYLGLDVRYHFVFFPDESQTYNSSVPAGSRAGDYFTPMLTLTYNF